jgi:hypothetical protein
MFNETKHISSRGRKWDGIKKILDLVIYIYIYIYIYDYIYIWPSFLEKRILTFMFHGVKFMNLKEIDGK